MAEAAVEGETSECRVGQEDVDSKNEGIRVGRWGDMGRKRCCQHATEAKEWREGERGESEKKLCCGRSGKKKKREWAENESERRYDESNSGKTGRGSRGARGADGGERGE